MRQQIVAGRTDGQIKRYLTDRYGDFVLERPAFSPGNAILWGAPFSIVLVGGAVLLVRRRGRSNGARQDETPLSPEEEAKVTAISSQLD